MKPYKFLEHTADIAVEVYGRNIEELIKNSTIAFRDAFVYPENLESIEEKEIELEVDVGEDENLEKIFEYVLYDWLNELLYLFDAEHFAVLNAKVKVEINSKVKIFGKLKGGKLTEKAVKVEPKAITLHNFKVVREKNILKAFFIIDI